MNLQCSLAHPQFFVSREDCRTLSTQRGGLCLGLMSLWLSDRGGSLKRLHWPNRYGFGWVGLKGNLGFNVIPSLDAIASTWA